MNRIIAVDDKRNFALVEPGASYFDVYRHIQEHRLNVWLDVPATGWGSLIGNALEYGVGYTASPFRDHFGSHCGMEVVLPTGEVMRTGMGALPGAETWQDYRYGVGPYVDGLFAQSNFGIVTKMGFWLMPQPEAWLTGIIHVSRYTDLAALIEQVNYLEDSQIMNGKPFYNSPVFHPFEGSYPSAPPPAVLEELMAKGWPSEAEIEVFARRHGTMAWWVQLHFYGPEKTIRANWEYAQKRISKAIPGTSVRDVVTELQFPLTGPPPGNINLVDIGIPNLSVFGKSAAELDADELHAPLQGHGDFLAILPRTAEAVMRAQRVLYETQKAVGAPLTATPFHAPIAWHHRSFLMGSPTMALYQSDPERNRKAGILYEAYVKNMAAAGFPPYRTNPAMQDLLVDQFSYNDHALLRFQQKLKDAVDPNGIIAPGRYGLGPKKK
jgi:4-cresol dehydrogenase (hydroxylating)